MWQYYILFAKEINDFLQYLVYWRLRNLYKVRQWIGRFCNTVFFWFGNSGADSAIAILVPTLKRFSCNGAVDCSTKCFCFESVLQKRWQFCDRSAWISKRVRDSSQSCCSISLCHLDLGSKLRGYWFCTKEERWWPLYRQAKCFRYPLGGRLCWPWTMWRRQKWIHNYAANIYVRFCAVPFRN